MTQKALVSAPEMSPVISSLVDQMSHDSEFYTWDPSIVQIMSTLNQKSSELKTELFAMRRGEINHDRISQLAAEAASCCAKVHQLYGQYHFENSGKRNGRV